MSKVYLFSNAKTCPPCTFLRQELDNTVPNWQDKVEYVDLNKALSEEQEALKVKLGIRSIPALADENGVIGVGFGSIYNYIKKL